MKLTEDKLWNASHFEGVVFDMDGVIFDSERLVYLEWVEMSKKYGIPNITEVYRRCIGVTYDRTKQIFYEAYGDRYPYEVYKKEVSANFHAKYDGGRLPVKKGVRELLAYLKEKKIPTAIASSTRSEIVHTEITDAGLMTYFTKIIGGDMVTRSKPNPDIFLKACEEIGVNPVRTLGVEDSYNGIRALHAAGMPAVMVPDMVQPDEEMKLLATWICKDLEEVLLGLSQSEKE